MIDFDVKYPEAGEELDGLKVTKNIPNQNSIAGTFSEYDILPGVRSISLADWGDCSPKKVFYDPKDITKTTLLAHSISENGYIDPLIVSTNGDDTEMDVVEGLHRLSALYMLGKTHFPALIVVNAEGVSKESIKEKSKSVVQQRLMGMAYAYKIASPEERKKMKASLTVKKLAHSMTKKDLEDFASTKHDGLPVKKEDVQEGAQEERSEHDPQYDWLFSKMKAFYSANKRFPSKKEFDEYEDEFFNKVAKSHTDKFPDYYDALDKMEAELEKK